MMFYEDESVQIGIDKDLDATFMIYKENVSPDDFINTHRKVVDMLNAIDVCSGKHLVDTKPIKLVSLEGQKWVAENVVPLIHKKSNRDKAQIALVMSSDVFAQFAVQNISKKTDGISETHFFNTSDDAKNWLNGH